MPIFVQVKNKQDKQGKQSMQIKHNKNTHNTQNKLNKRVRRITSKKGGRLLMPEEIDIYYLIPSIRRELAFCLLKNGIKVKEVAKLLGITSAAVTQYIKEKRGKFVQVKALKREINKSAVKILCNESCFKEFYLKELRKLLIKANRLGIRCNACRKYNKAILMHCHQTLCK